MTISRIDHLVLTVRSVETTCAFYERVLGFTRRDVPGRPTALHFGNSKFNVHQADHVFEPKAFLPTPGSADFCLITDGNTDDLLTHLTEQGVAIEIGPVAREGAEGAIVSVYFRDPDRNLIEVSRYIESTPI